MNAMLMTIMARHKVAYDGFSNISGDQQMQKDIISAFHEISLRHPEMNGKIGSLKFLSFSKDGISKPTSLGVTRHWENLPRNLQQVIINADFDVQRLRLSGLASKGREGTKMLPGRRKHSHIRDHKDAHRYTIFHEYGHTIDNTLNNVPAKNVTMWVSDYYKSIGKPQGWISDWDVSQYSLLPNGMPNPKEFIAESFADVEINGNSAAPVSKYVYDRMMAMMKAQGATPNAR